jgi:hypothetical protein
MWAVKKTFRCSYTKVGLLLTAKDTYAENMDYLNSLNSSNLNDISPLQ